MVSLLTVVRLVIITCDKIIALPPDLCGYITSVRRGRGAATTHDSQLHGAPVGQGGALAVVRPGAAGSRRIDLVPTVLRSVSMQCTSLARCSMQCKPYSVHAMMHRTSNLTVRFSVSPLQGPGREGEMRWLFHFQDRRRFVGNLQRYFLSTYLFPRRAGGGLNKINSVRGTGRLVSDDQLGQETC
jgi:hypothetical protein